LRGALDEEGGVRRRGAETEVLGGSGGNQGAVETTRREEDDDRGKRGCGARAVRARRRRISRWAAGICAEGSVTECPDPRLRVAPVPPRLSVLWPGVRPVLFVAFRNPQQKNSRFSHKKSVNFCVFWPQKKNTTVLDHSYTSSAQKEELKSTDLPKGKLRIAFSCSLKIQKDNCSLTKFDSIQPIRHQLLLPDR